MSKHGILATSEHYRANMVLPKSLLRWRAADSRPYADGATESAGRKFRGVAGEFDRDFTFPAFWILHAGRMLGV